METHDATSVQIQNSTACPCLTKTLACPSKTTSPLHADAGEATAAALREMPESTVLLDHLAEPHTTSAVDYADLLDLASFDQVFMKLSGLGHFAGDAPLYASAMPFTARVIAAYGPDNLVWGSGTPDIVDAHMPRHTEAERKQVKGDNLARLLQVEDQKP